MSLTLLQSYLAACLICIDSYPDITGYTCNYLAFIILHKYILLVLPTFNCFTGTTKCLNRCDKIQWYLYSTNNMDPYTSCPGGRPAVRKYTNDIVENL